MSRRTKDWNEGLTQQLKDREFAREFILASRDEQLSLQETLKKVILAYGLKDFSKWVRMSHRNVSRTLNLPILVLQCLIGFSNRSVCRSRSGLFPKECHLVPSDFDKILDQEYHYFLHLKRLYLLQTNVLTACEGRTIRNNLIYQQLLFASFDGLFTRLDNFHLRLLKFLNVLKNEHIDRFKRSNKKGLAIDPKSLNCINGPDPGAASMARTMTKEAAARPRNVIGYCFGAIASR